MNRNDIPAPAFRPLITDIPLAFGLLTRIPLPDAVFPDDPTRPAAHAAWAYPLVGLAAAALCVAAGVLSLAMGLTATIAALLVVCTGLIVTGALHEDGLADCADGFWGSWTPPRRLEIMKDSQVGTYGVLALMGAVGLRWAALAALIGAGTWGPVFIAAAVVSRAAMVAVMHLLPHARDAGLSRETGQPPRAAALVAGLLGLSAVFWAFGLNALPIIAATAVLSALAVAGIAKAKIGGQTGDVLGATQQVVELAVLLGAVALLA